MLKMTFEDGEIKDVGRDLWLDLRHPYSMEAIRDDTAVGGWTGAFRGSGISVPFFKMVGAGDTLRASVSGTFLQTLPKLLTLLKAIYGALLSPCSCPSTQSAPSERLGY